MAGGLASKAYRSGISLGPLATASSHFTISTGIRCHAAQYGRHAAGGAVPAFVEFFIFPDGCDQVDMFLLIWADLSGALAICLAIPKRLWCRGRLRTRRSRYSVVGGIGCTVSCRRVGEFDEVIVVDLADASVVAAVAASHAVGLDGMIALGPIADVEVVDVLLDDVVAAEPDEVIPVAHLVFHFGLAGLARRGSKSVRRSSTPASRVMSPIFAVVDFLDALHDNFSDAGAAGRRRLSSPFRRPACWFP